MATIDEFKNIDLRVGKIIEVEVHEKAKKPIYKFKVDLGELGIRDIASGIRDDYTKEELIGKEVVVVANLEPKDIAGFISNGMILAGEDDEKIALLTLDRELKPGSKIT